jgi:CRP/FNR family transcriptional regulator
VLPKLAALSEIALFAALSENELQALAQRAVEKRFGTDEMLFWEGEACVGIFLIIQGRYFGLRRAAARLFFPSRPRRHR